MNELAGKVAVVVGGGQTPGSTVGNGRAAALLYAREGALVVVADRDLDSALETERMIRDEGGTAVSARVDVTSESDIAQMIEVCLATFGGLDILHNNVGVTSQGGDASVLDIEAGDFARLVSINLGGMVLACKHALPVMRQAGAGVITNISSNAVLIDYPYISYKTSKAGVIALTESIAISNAPFGIRANTILPGLMDTPMAVEHKIGVAGQSREDVLNDRTSRTPLAGRPGNAWDVANAAVFLASEKAAFITGASLVIDGGQHLAAG